MTLSVFNAITREKTRDVVSVINEEIRIMLSISKGHFISSAMTVTERLPAPGPAVDAM